MRSGTAGSYLRAYDETAMKTKSQFLARTPSPACRSENGPEAMPSPSSLRATLSRRERIEDLRQRRAFYNWLGKRKKVAMIDAQLIPLVNEELAQENLVAQVAKDLMWIAGQEKAA